ADASGTVREISEKFGHAELQKLYGLLNSDEFQKPLTNFNCGDPAGFHSAFRIPHHWPTSSSKTENRFP
ncbi:MAG: hypothetical protein ACXWC8_11860, partial [Limisphaerales bacterium]